MADDRRWIIRARLQFITLLLCSLLPTAGFTQQSVVLPNKAPAAAVANPNHRITLDVVVTDKSGKPVAGLQEQDFTVLDDKRPTKILSFAAIDESDPPKTPVQGVVVMDAVNIPFQRVGYERQQLEKFLRMNGGRLAIPMSLVFVTDAGAQMQPASTRDGNALAGLLNSNQTGLRSITRSAGFYGAIERVQMSLNAIDELATYEAKQPGRKLVLWLSRGWPLLSGPNIELTAKDQQAIFQTIVSFSDRLREAGIALYSIDQQGPEDAGSLQAFYYQEFVKGVPSANKAQNGNLGLQVLAAQTGGQVLTSSNDIVGAIASCVQDAKAFYIISIESPPADSPNEYHAVQVKMAKHGLTARTRTGYYAQPYKE